MNDAHLQIPKNFANFAHYYDMTDIINSIIEGIQDRKGKKITLIDLSKIGTAPASRFVVCQGNSPTQTAAIADSVRDKVLEQTHRKPYNYDGYGAASWIVLDYGDTLVHIFTPETRQRYNLEDLWYDANISEIPDLD